MGTPVLTRYAHGFRRRRVRYSNAKLETLFLDCWQSSRRGYLVSAALGLAFALLGAGEGPCAEVVKYYHLDAIGNVRVVTDRAGTVLERFDYYPFGEDIVTPSTPTHLRFTS